MVFDNGQVVKYFSRLALLGQGRKPQRRSSRVPLIDYIARLGSIQFFGDEVVKCIEIALLQRRQGTQLTRHGLNLRIQETFPQRIVQLPFVQCVRADVLQTFGCVMRTVAQLNAVFGSNNTVAHIHHPAHHGPRRAGRIKHRITGIEQICPDPTVVHPHRILQYRLIKQHLHQVVFFRFYLTANAVLVRLTR